MRSKLLWPIAAVAATVVGAIIPKLFFTGYYFVTTRRQGPTASGSRSAAGSSTATGPC